MVKFGPLLRRRYISNILISLILSLSLFIFGVYVFTSERKRTSRYIEEELLPTRINSFVLSMQARFFPAIIAGETVAKTIVPVAEAFTTAEIKELLKTIAAHPMFENAEGVDYFRAAGSVLYTHTGSAPRTTVIPRGEEWSEQVLTKPNSSIFDIIYLPGPDSCCLYLRYPLYDDRQRFIGFIGFRYSYDEITRFITETRHEQQEVMLVNGNGQILYEPGRDKRMFAGRETPFFLSQHNPRQYLGPLNRVIGLEEESHFLYTGGTAYYLTYNQLLKAYFIVEDSYYPAERNGTGRSTLIAVVIGIGILLINIYTIFSYQQYIIKKNRYLGQLLEERGLFLSLMSHNVNNTISVLSNDLRFALQEGKPLSVQRKMILLSWIDTTKRLISNIIFYLRNTDEGKFVIHNGPVNMEELLQTLLIRNREKGELKEQNFVLEILTKKTEVMTDRNLLLEALDNLVDNGIKYSPIGGTITILLDRDNSGAVTVTVSDTGPGIPEEDRETLFEPFTPGKTKPTGGEQSTGIGLHVARSLVVKLGGTLTLTENTAGPECGGAAFLLTLPSK
jgi:signal transduction histidine kinase